MALRRRSSGGDPLNVWPGYVDALSTLLMVIIFVLLVFVLAQAFLTVALSGRDQALDKLNRQIAELSDMLSLERGRTAELQGSVAQAGRDLQAAGTARDQLAQQLAAVQADQAKLTTERDALRSERDRLSARLADAALQTQAAQSRTEDLTAQLAEAARRTDSQAQAQAAAAAQAAEEKRLGDAARDQLALTSRQLDELRAQLAALQKALDVAETAARDKDTQIATLGGQLNAALARKVEELQRYRSDFFGRLRTLLANRPGIQVVGDRFVFQSEVLFPVGSADLTAAGADEIHKLSETLKAVSKEIPGNIAWILRVDGHADHQPVEKGPWGSNWELSAGRAITVVKLLIADGIAPNRLAATGFGDNQPLDPAGTPEAYAKNRRIEIRLTDR